MLQVSLDSHLNLSAGSALGANASETALDFLHPGNSFKRFCYSVSHGAMIDGSWNGEHPRWIARAAGGAPCNDFTLADVQLRCHSHTTYAKTTKAGTMAMALLVVQAPASVSRTRTSSSCTARRPDGKLCWLARCSRRQLPHGCTRRSTACPSLLRMQRHHDSCSRSSSSHCYLILIFSAF